MNDLFRAHVVQDFVSQLQKTSSSQATINFPLILHCLGLLIAILGLVLAFSRPVGALEAADS